MHIMIDLETMGTRPNAPIISIGAVAFDGEGIVSKFYRTVALQSSVRSGAVIDPNTVMWWMGQDVDARSALMDDESEPLKSVLGDLRQMVCSYGDDLKGVWGNGASFDNVIVTESCFRLGMPACWEFWKDRCYRTVKNMYPDVPMVRQGTHHNALDDARTQAEHLIAISKSRGDFL